MFSLLSLFALEFHEKDFFLFFQFAPDNVEREDDSAQRFEHFVRDERVVCEALEKKHSEKKEQVLGK